MGRFKSQSRSSPRNSNAVSARSVARVVMVVTVIAAAVWGTTALLRHDPVSGASNFSKRPPRPDGELTFSRDIAPVIERRCAGCHRPGQIGPFSLLTYEDVRKRTGDVARVTRDRVMPPWLPSGDGVKFAGDRRLDPEELELLQQWIREGAKEGTPMAASTGRVTNEWQSGTPDLIVTMPEPYLLQGEGRDVYRNFVVKVPLATGRWVKGVEFKPGHPRVVHHAFLKVDSTDQSRRADEHDPGPGFAGMNPAATTPGGHFLGWQPGRVPEFAPDGLAWRLDPGTDLVLELHLNPSGKPEPVQTSVGFFFTDRPATNTCFKVYLTSYVFEIPAGASHHVVEDSYTLPIDVQALAVLPHAHYLGKDLAGWAELPDGRRQELLHIPQWDFNWQGDYRYAEPIELPKGTRLRMRYTYDNSTNNVRNPHQPPRLIRYGSQSVDEMAELWLQLLPRRPSELAVLTRDFEARMARLFEEHDRFDLRNNPNDPKLYQDLGMLLLTQNRLEEAAEQFNAAVQRTPDYEPAHYGLGLVRRRQGRLPEARAEFEISVGLDPRNFKAHGNLGFILLQLGEAVAAQERFRNALALNPDDALARDGLNAAIKAAVK